MNTRYIARHVNYFLGKPGHDFALVFEDRVVDIQDRSYSKLLSEPGLVGLIESAPAMKTRFERLTQTTWRGSVPLLTTDGMRYIPSVGTKEEAAEACRKEARLLREEADREATDPAYALEKALKNHDWFAHYSDDNNVCLASEQHWQKIEGLKLKVPKDVAEALVNQYQPK